MRPPRRKRFKVKLSRENIKFLKQTARWLGVSKGKVLELIIQIHQFKMSDPIYVKEFESMMAEAKRQENIDSK